MTRKQTTPSAREEKLSALSALLGPEAMGRLRKRQPGFEADAAADAAPSADRVAWHGNRLLERLRSKEPGDAGAALPAKEHVAQPKAAPSKPPQPQAAEPKQTQPQAAAQTEPPRPRPAAAAPSGRAIDLRIAAAVDLSALAAEHPAVIVRILRGLGRAERVETLRRLPGRTAREAVRRLRAA
jgi:hypothetical protein